MSITVHEVFRAAGLKASGPVRWGEIVPEKQAGVYIVAAVEDPDEGCGAIDVSYLKDQIAERWIPSEPVIYIGRSRRPLSLRIREFNKHIHGAKSPHQGGQDAKLLRCPLWVFWSPTQHAAIAEDKMIERFKSEVGRLPFANRVRSAQAKKTSRPDML
jgi:hypothetical protein